MDTMTTQPDYAQRWTLSGGNLHRFDQISDFDFYKRIPGWFDFQDVYDIAVAEARDGATFVELGSFMGRSTAYLGSRVALARKKVTIFAVDPWLGWDATGPSSTFPNFLNNMMQAGLMDFIVPLRMMSVQAVRLFDNDSIDFCFIDADHTYEAVSEDLRLWNPKMRPGGLLAGHDYVNPDHLGVKAAVDEFFRGQVGVTGMSWNTRKPS